jgi:hypothetical protein
LLRCILLSCSGSGDIGRNITDWAGLFGLVVENLRGFADKAELLNALGETSSPFTDALFKLMGK